LIKGVVMRKIILALTAFSFAVPLAAPNGGKVGRSHPLARQAHMKNPDGFAIRPGDSSADIDERARAARRARAPKMHPRSLRDSDLHHSVPLREGEVLPALKGALARVHEERNLLPADIKTARSSRRSRSPVRSRASSDSSDVSSVSASSGQSRRSSVASIFAAEDALLGKVRRSERRMLPSLVVSEG
jgi:hypothetical protein